MIAARTKHNSVRSLLSLRAFTAIGVVSYSLYLIHAPLLQVVWQYGAAPAFDGTLARFLATSLAGVPLIGFVLFLMYRYGERPFLMNSRNFRAKPASIGAGGKGS